MKIQKEQKDVKDIGKKNGKKGGGARTMQGEEEENVYLSTGQLGIQAFRDKPTEIIGVGYYGRDR